MPDWHGMFHPASLLEVFIRASILYLFIFVLLRAVRRETGSVSVADTLVLVLLADAAQNGMAGQYQSIPEGFVIVSTIVFWSWLFDWAGYKYPALGGLLHAKPIELVKNGSPLLVNLRRNLITMDELMTAVRQSGAADLSEVKRAWLESNGEVSVVAND